MSSLISFNSSYIKPYIQDHEFDQLDAFVRVAHDMIHRKNEVGKDWLGWVEWPRTCSKEELRRIQDAANRIQHDADALVIIGIGGSYLGARAVIEMLTHPFYNCLPKGKRPYPQIYYVGHHLSADYIHGLLDILEDKEVCINVISKSGTTLEPGIAFHIFREYMRERYGTGASKRIYATTDEKEGVLRKLADEEGYKTFIIPSDIGGRYSVLTPVGLLPIAVAGIDIEQVITGAQEASEMYSNFHLRENSCYQYAVIRNLLYRKGKRLEILVNYLPHLTSFSEWWKQLMGESEGKDGKGIFPASVHFTTDLHSMGQYIQDGLRSFFQTVLFVEHSQNPIYLSREIDCQLPGLAGMSLDDVNATAFQGTLKAHIDGGVPTSVIKVTHLSPRACGSLIYFFQKACALSCYLMGVNPFDQPGVEVYKKNMQELLGKYKNSLHIY